MRERDGRLGSISELDLRSFFHVISQGSFELLILCLSLLGSGIADIHHICPNLLLCIMHLELCFA